MILGDEANARVRKRDLSLEVTDALAKGHVLLRTCPERLLARGPEAPPIHLKITKVLGEIAHSALEGSNIDPNDLALIIIGGDTARSVFHSLEFRGLEIMGEIMEGVIMSRLIGGKWSGLKVITKAGAFGKEDTLEKIGAIVRGKQSSPEV